MARVMATINRYAIRDRMPLKQEPDDSTIIYLQSASPGADKEANWLPAPKQGKFSVSLRLRTLTGRLAEQPFFQVTEP
jgi:hypothetical protein